MLVPELQKMSCRCGIYKICSVLGTPTTAWTLAPESSALFWHPPQLTPNCWFGFVVWGLNPWIMLKLNGKPPPILQNTDPNYQSKPGRWQPGVPSPKRAAENLQPPPGHGPEHSRRGGQGERRGSAETSA